MSLLAALLLAATADCGSTVFFATYQGLSPKYEMRLAHGILVRGRAVPPALARTELECCARYLFAVDEQNELCAPPRRVSSREFAAVWKELRGRDAAVPSLAVAEVRACGKTFTLYDDGTLVIDGTERVTRRIPSERVQAIRALFPKKRVASAYLSYIPSGLQEMLLAYDDGEWWTGAVVYRRCGPVDPRVEHYETPETATVADAILAAAGELDAIARCNCISH